MKTVYLLKTGNTTYYLQSDTGAILTDVLHFSSMDEALEWARAWISSWNDVELRVK